MRGFILGFIAGTWFGIIISCVGIYIEDKRKGR
jgi:hypothetical protein